MLQSMHCFRSAISRTSATVWCGVAALLLCPGCLVPASRMDSCQARYHQLSEKNKTLQTQIANLEAACRTLEAERDQSEQELVVLDREIPLLFAKRRQLAQPQSAAGSQLKTLAVNTAGLDFDPASGALTLKSETFFRPGTELKAASGEPLGALAAILNQPSLQRHRVLIVTNGSSSETLATHQRSLQRALALQEFFHGWGIEKYRLGVSNYGHISRGYDAALSGHDPIQSDAEKMKIFLLKEDFPVIGWDTWKAPNRR
ncbi:MAG: hypothetical protein CMJ74_04660 [Planctomycetaceae bacterium]|nr:hypothetical protein [Planctomycetaceae bacterium]